MKRRSGWIAAALLGAGLLFALATGQSVRADSHEATASGSDAVEPLEQVAEDTADEPAGKGKAKAGKRRSGGDRGAGQARARTSHPVRDNLTGSAFRRLDLLLIALHASASPGAQPQ